MIFCLSLFDLQGYSARTKRGLGGGFHEDGEFGDKMKGIMQVGYFESYGGFRGCHGLSLRSSCRST